MTKYLLFLVAVAGLIFSNSGCTSKKAEADQQIVENADVEKIEAEGLGAVEQDIDSSLEAAMGESGTAPSATPPAEVASAAPTLDETSLNTTAPASPTDVAATTTTTIESAITETPVAPVEATTVDTSTAAVASDVIAPTETSAAETAAAAETALSDAKAATSSENLPKPSAGAVLKKIAATAPYQGKDGGWINAVYIARPKEKLNEISLKIYGTDKSNDLKNIAENNYLKSRAVRAGDKIYYVSPNRPDDSSKTMIYYEDMGMIPETYVAKKGENLRKVSKKLLGYDNAWKEVWSSNSIESKTSLKDGETFRYWKMADAAATAAAPTAPPTSGATLIDAAQAPEVTAQTTPPTAAAATEPSLPPPPADANANLPPPPADMAATSAPAAADSAAAASATEPGLPPPPTEELAAPPPPPPPEAVAEAAPRKKVNLDEAAAEEEESEGLDSDTMMSMAALGVLVALMAFVIIRKKKQKAEQMASEMNA